MNQMSKSQLASLVARGLCHEAFTHTVAGSFDITLMRQQARAGQYGPPRRADIDATLIEFVANWRDWEQARVNEILVSGDLSDPGLMIQMPDGTHLLVDGTHRILARHTMGLRHFTFYMVPLKAAPRPDHFWIDSEAAGLGGWGKYENRDGKLYDRQTGAEWTGKESEEPKK